MGILFGIEECRSLCSDSIEYVYVVQQKRGISQAQMRSCDDKINKNAPHSQRTANEP